MCTDAVFNKTLGREEVVHFWLHSRRVSYTNFALCYNGRVLPHSVKLTDANKRDLYSAIRINVAKRDYTFVGTAGINIDMLLFVGMKYTPFIMCQVGEPDNVFTYHFLPQK